MTLTPPSFPDAARITDLALNDGGQVCITVSDGSVWCWRMNTREFEPEQIPLSDPAIQLFGSTNSFCAVNASGRVSCWGNVGIERARWREPRLLPIPRPSEMVFGPQGGCALVESGSVRCWGLAWIRTHSRTLESIETRAGLRDIVTIDGAGLSRCAVEPDHRVSCWGWDHYDHLGPREEDGYFRHRQIRDAVDIALSHHHLWWVDSHGRVRGMERGQADQRSGTYRYEAVTVRGIEDAVSLASDSTSVCAVTATGALWCWRPSDREPRVAPFSGVTALRTSSTGTTCARTASSWFCRSANDEWEELEFGAPGNRARAGAQPMTESASSVCGPGPDHVGVVDLSAGYGHFCARLADGRVRCWGLNQDGQVSGRMTGDPVSSRAVPLPGQVRSVANGLHFSCALTEDGQMWCWGQGGYGQLARGDRGNSGEPRQVGVSGVRAMALGRMHACAIDVNRRLHCWGANEQGQLGDGTRTIRTVPVVVRAVRSARLVAAGPDSTCAASENRVLCWGGAAGSIRPEPIEGLDARRVRGLAAGRNASCALLDDGTVWCWGSGAEGQLGPAEPIESARAVRIEGLPSATQIAAYETEFCAVTNDHAVWCWGRPSPGRRPNRRSPDAPPDALPRRVEGLGQMLQVAPGNHEICAIEAAGGVCCWDEQERIRPPRW